MMASVLLYGILVCAFLHGIPTFASNHDEIKDHHHRHAEVHHRHHSRHGHKGFAARDSNATVTTLAPSNATVNSTIDSNSTTNSTLCLSSSQLDLATLIQWLNNSNDLRLLYELTPPSVKSQFSGTFNATITNSTNTTILNGTVTVDLNSMYVENSEYKIIQHFARVFGFLLATPEFVASEFGTNIAKTILQAFLGGRNSTGNFVGNVDNAVSVNGSWSNSNLTNWENWLLPSKIFNNVEHIEHAIEGGFSNLVHNVSNLLGFKKRT